MLGQPSKRARKRLEKDGRRALATVVEIATIGGTVRGGSFFGDQEAEQVRKSTLRVEPAGEPAFEVKMSLRYPASAVPAAGEQVPVIYDPEDHGTIMIGPIAAKTEAELGADLKGSGIGSGTEYDEASREEMLKEAQKWTEAFPDKKGKG